MDAKGGTLFGRNGLEFASGQANNQERIIRSFFIVRIWMYNIQKSILTDRRLSCYNKASNEGGANHDQHSDDSQTTGK